MKPIHTDTGTAAQPSTTIYADEKNRRYVVLVDGRPGPDGGPGAYPPPTIVLGERENRVWFQNEPLGRHDDFVPAAIIEFSPDPRTGIDDYLGITEETLLLIVAARLEARQGKRPGAMADAAALAGVRTALLALQARTQHAQACLTIERLSSYDTGEMLDSAGYLTPYGQDEFDRQWENDEEQWEKQQQRERAQTPGGTPPKPGPW